MDSLHRISQSQHSAGNSNANGTVHGQSSRHESNQNVSASSQYHLEKAVSNFHPQFTRMPLHSSEQNGPRRGSEDSYENEQTNGLFPGFTFDKEADDV